MDVTPGKWKFLLKQDKVNLPRKMPTAAIFGLLLPDFKVASTSFQPFNCVNFEIKEQKLRPRS